MRPDFEVVGFFCLICLVCGWTAALNMIFRSSAVKRGDNERRWLIDLRVKRRRGTREDGRQGHDQVPLTDLCCRTKQDLSRERSTCCCWCRRHCDFCPAGGLNYQPAKPCLFMVLGVCYSVPTGSRCQNSAAAPGLMGGLLMQIARGCIGGCGGGIVLKYGNVYVWKEDMLKDAEWAKGKDTGPFEGSWKCSNILTARTEENTSQTRVQSILMKSYVPHNIRSRAIWSSGRKSESTSLSLRGKRTERIFLLPQSSLNSKWLLAHHAAPVTVGFTSSNSYNIFRGVCDFTLPRRRAKYDKSLESNEVNKLIKIPLRHQC